MSPGSTLSPLTYRLFVVIWLSIMATQFGNSIQGVGAQWLMTAIDGRADLVGLVHTALTLPVMLFALVGGAIADMYDRRTVILAAQLAIAAVSIVLAAVAWWQLATPWLLIGLTLVAGVGMAFLQPAVNASIPALLPRSEISGGVSLNITGFNAARAIGPALGGVIVAAGGASAAFVVSAGFALLAAVILAGWRPPLPERAGSAGFSGVLPAIAEGVRAVRATPQLRSIALRSFGFTLCGTAVWGLMPLVARDIVGGGPERFGMLLGALGLGALAGSLASHEFRRRFTPEGLARTAALVFGTMAIVIALRPGFAVTLMLLAIGGGFWVQVLSGFTVSAQLWSPRHLVGRVSSIVTVMVWGGLALGAWLWGLFAEAFGMVACIAGSGLALFGVAAVGLVMPLPRNDLAPDASVAGGR